MYLVWAFTERNWLYFDCIILCVSCNMIVLTCNEWVFVCVRFVTCEFVYIRGIIIKFANSSRYKFYIPHCWIPPWLPSKYSPCEAMHRFKRLVHPSEKFWNWFCGMAFRAAVVLSLCNQCHQNAFLSIFPLSSGTEKSHWGLDPVNRQGVPTQLFV